MEDYKHGNHTVWDCKYISPGLGDEISLRGFGWRCGHRCWELLREIASDAHHRMVVYFTLVLRSSRGIRGEFP
jgi:hypothetical protein